MRIGRRRGEEVLTNNWLGLVEQSDVSEFTNMNYEAPHLPHSWVCESVKNCLPMVHKDLIVLLYHFPLYF